MLTHEINFTGKTPEPQEYASLTAIPFEKKPISKVERDSIIKTGLTFLIGAIVMPLLGILFTRMSSLGGAGSGIVGIMGIGFIVLSPIVFLMSVFTFLGIWSDPRNKNSQTALQGYLKRVLIGDDTEVFAGKNLNYAYSVLNRMIPDQLMPERELFDGYINEFRSKFRDMLQKDAKHTFNTEVEENFNSPIFTFKVISAESLTPNIEKAVVEFNVSHQRKLNPDAKNATLFSQIKITMTAMVVKSDKYCFLYDPMPMYEIENETNENQALT